MVHVQRDSNGRCVTLQDVSLKFLCVIVTYCYLSVLFLLSDQ